MKARGVILAGLQATVRAALDAAGRQGVPVIAMGAAEDVWTIIPKPAVAVAVYGKRAIGGLALGGGNVEQNAVLRVVMAILVEDPTTPTGGLEEIEAIADDVELALRSANLAAGSTMSGTVRLSFVEESLERAPVYEAGGGGLLALLQTYDTTEFYE